MNAPYRGCDNESRKLQNYQEVVVQKVMKGRCLHGQKERRDKHARGACEFDPSTQIIILLEPAWLSPGLSFTGTGAVYLTMYNIVLR